VGLALARHLRAGGIGVTATTRDPARFDEIAATGAVPVLADVMDPPTLRPLVEAAPTAVYDLVRPQRLDTHRYTSWGTQNVASAFADVPLEALVYVSSTSVY